MRAGRRVVAAILLAALGAPVACATLGGSGARGRATVVHVVDGDTLVADVGGRSETVRLIGVDTPEKVKPGTPVECFAEEASARTAQLLPEGTPVRLVLDAEARDHYDRLLAYVYRDADGLFVNLALVTDGYADELTFPPNTTHRSELRAAAASARAAPVGLWASCDGPHSPR